MVMDVLAGEWPLGAARGRTLYCWGASSSRHCSPGLRIPAAGPASLLARALRICPVLSFRIHHLLGPAPRRGDSSWPAAESARLRSGQPPGITWPAHPVKAAPGR
jgi:hypothetical protein